MLDIKFIRENADLIKEAARKKHIKIDVERLLAIDEKRRTMIAEIDEMRREHKVGSGQLARHTPPESGQDERDKLLSHLKEGKDKLSHKEFELRAVEGEFDELMLAVPNVPDPSVPEGDSDAENQEIRKWGEPGIEHGRNYMSLMQMHDMLETERGSKVSGFRGYFLKNDGAMLVMALWNLALEHLIKKGFQPFMAPSLVRRENLVGTGWFGGPNNPTEEDVYKTQDDTYLSGTAEVAMMGYHRDEVLAESEFPKKYAAFSPCFRREAGSYGKDTKGIFRVHEFFKIEQVILCRADHQESVNFHEELTKNSEEIMQMLEIPYHVVLNCGGDLGLGQVKKYDIEGWLPSEKKYRETHSASYFHDFQTRRLNIKYKDSEGKSRFAHSLNNTAIATPRILAMLLENHQNADGSINIPKALQKFFGKEQIR
jgi:seryl-tRNA synthetase